MNDDAGDERREQRISVGALIRMGAPPLSAREQQKGWIRIRSSLEARQPRGRARRLLVALGGAVTASVLVAGAVLWWQARVAREPAPLTYDIDRGERRAAGTVRGAEGGETRIRFSDGTSVDLESGALARVASVEQAGANLALVIGEIVVNVVHHPTSKWTFQAGPFSVLVEGTSFALRWSAVDQELRLRMFTGVVTVRGAIGTDAITVRGGQTLTIDRSHNISLAQAAVGESATLTARPAPSLEPPPASRPETAGPPPPDARRTGGGGGSWRDWIAAGRSADVVRDAVARGLETTFARGRRDEIAALADAARYSRQVDVARGALGALRRRFATSASGRDAAFFLGMLEEGEHPGSTRALEWYRRYRAEAPSGLYIGEALGREMSLVRRLQGADAARPLARDYLTRFPHGTSAAEAADIAGH